jgi:D-glycero-alpha-D-manno-heptose 1-phosphate guanylyltransferase
VIEAIVLAGGFGTRLREAVPDVPKPMAPIAGKPFLEVLLSSLADKGFKRIILSLGFMAETISSHFGERYADMELVYVVEETPLGTGGAVRLAMTQCRADHIYVFNGDTYVDLEVDQVEHLWQLQYNAIIVGRKVPDTGRYGRLLVSDGLVCGFREKGDTGPGLINAGCYVLSTNQLDDWPVNTPFSLESDYFVQAVAVEAVDFFETSGLFIDIGIPEDFNLAQTLLAGNV